MSKKQRHERKKIERARRCKGFHHSRSAIRNSGTALAAAAALAAGTSTYATPVRFDNPVGVGHFDWPHDVGVVEKSLDISLPASAQPGDHSAATSFAQILGGGVGTIYGFGGGRSVQTTDGYVMVGVSAAELIPTPGTMWSLYGGYTHLPPGAPLLPENQETYLGVRFDLGGGSQYGWIGVIRTGIELDAFAWGYETEPGVPIPAGAPEPGSLALLAFGAAGLLTHRNRGNAQHGR